MWAKMRRGVFGQASSLMSGLGDVSARALRGIYILLRCEHCGSATAGHRVSTAEVPREGCAGPADDTSSVTLAGVAH